MKRALHIFCLLAFLATIMTSWVGEAGACADNATYKGGATHAALDSNDKSADAAPAALPEKADQHNCPDGCHHHAHSLLKTAPQAVSEPFVIKEASVWPAESGAAQHNPSLYKPPIE